VEPVNHGLKPLNCEPKEIFPLFMFFFSGIFFFHG
jgi:hypothetical protein